MPTVAEIKAEARENHVPWATVREIAEAMIEAERESRGYDNEVRQFAWFLVTAHTPASQPFWRHGFRSRFGRRVEKHGYEAIPRHDLIHMQVASQFPRFDTPTGIDDLFDFLFADYVPLTPRGEVYAAALAFALEEAEAAAADADIEFDPATFADDDF